jgi:putative holliday junction resolvase
MLASPVETVPRGRGDLRRIASIAAERAALEVLVGLPRALSGTEGPAAEAARTFAWALARQVAPRPVRLVDERLSTVQATKAMRESGVSERAGRARVDQAAAVVILQDALDQERASGVPAGELVQVEQ